MVIKLLFHHEIMSKGGDSVIQGSQGAGTGNSLLTAFTDGPLQWFVFAAAMCPELAESGCIRVLNT